MNRIDRIAFWLRGSWPIVVLLLVSAALNFYHLDWGLPNGATSWAWDANTPVSPLRMAYLISRCQFYFSKYPVAHNVLLLGLSAPYIAYIHMNGEFKDPVKEYPYGFSDPERSLAILFLIDRAVSALMGVGIVLLLYLIGRRRFGELAGLISAAAIALNVIFIYHSHTTNVDIPYLFWMMVALYFFDRALESGELKHFVLLSVFAAISLCTKESVVGVLVGMVIPLAWVVLRGRRWKGLGVIGVIQAIADKRLLIGLATFLIAFGLVGCAVPGLGYWFAKLSWASPQFEVSGEHVVRTGAAIKDLRIMATIFGYVSRSFGIPMSALLWLGALCLIIGSWRHIWPYMILSVSYYVVFLRNWTSSSYRFSMPQFIFLALIGAPLIAYIIQGRIPFPGRTTAVANRILRLGAVRATARVLIVGVFSYSLLYAATMPWLLSHDARYAAEAWLENNAQKGQTIELLMGEISSPRPPQWMTTVKLDKKRDRTPEAVATRGSDFMIMSGLQLTPQQYPKHFHFDILPVVKALESGALGYERVAMFKTRPFIDIPLSHSTINPLIVIYKRTASAGTRAESLSEDGAP